MSRKRPRPAAPAAIVPPAAPAPRQRRWLAWSAAAIIVATMAVAGGIWGTRVARLHAAIPVTPSLAGKPAAMVEAVGRSAGQAHSLFGAADGLRELGYLYHINGYTAEAEACWRGLQAYEPKEARWAYFLADLKRAAGDYDAMTALLQTTVRLDPNYAPAWLLLGEYQLKTGELEAAEQSFARRLTLLSADPYARLWLARVAQQKHDTAKARQLVEELVHDSPQLSSAHNLYAEMLAAAGDEAGAERQRWLGRETMRFREAEDPWLAAMRPWCYDFAQLCEWGTVEFQTQNGDQAKALFKRAIELRPDDPVGYEHLATVFLKLNDPAETRNILEQGLARSRAGQKKPSPMFFINLSHAYRLLKKPDEAVRIAREGLALGGDEYELYDALGMALGDLGRRDEAVAMLQAAVERGRNDSNANYNLGLALLAVNRGEEAIAALQRALVLEPTNPDALMVLGRMALDAKNFTGAAKYLEPLLASHPEKREARLAMAEWHLGMGRAAEQHGDKAEAEKQYRAGLVVEPNWTELQLSLGLLCLMQYRFPDALEPLEKYHQMKAKDARGCLYLGQTYFALGRRDDARRVLEEGAAAADQSGNPTTAAFCREVLQSLR